MPIPLNILKWLWEELQSGHGNGGKFKQRNRKQEEVNRRKAGADD